MEHSINKLLLKEWKMARSLSNAPKHIKLKATTNNNQQSTVKTSSIYPK
jgi:hypothetical protein